MGGQASLWLIILTVAVAVGIGFLIPVLLELHRSAQRLTSVLTITEQSLGPLLRDLDATVKKLDRITDDIGAVTDDVRVLSHSARRVGRSIESLSDLVSIASLGLGTRLAALKVGLWAGLKYLIRNLFRFGKGGSA
jgi:uncharacterized protein YoxC